MSRDFRSDEDTKHVIITPVSRMDLEEELSSDSRSRGNFVIEIKRRRKKKDTKTNRDIRERRENIKKSETEWITKWRRRNEEKHDDDKNIQKRERRKSGRGSDGMV